MRTAHDLYRIHETNYPFPHKCSITGASCEVGFDCRQCNVLLAEMMGRNIALHMEGIRKKVDE